MKSQNFVLGNRKLLLMLWLLFFGMTQTISAQDRTSGEVGIGFQAGQPTGVSVKIYKPNSWSPDFLAAWDLNDFFFLNVHAIKENHIGDSQRFHFFYGPGAFIGIDDRPKEFDDEVVIGLSGSFGLSLVFGDFEFFVQGTPRLSLIDSTNFDLGGGFGVRFYL
jgi:hypothetical protein